MARPLWLVTVLLFQIFRVSAQDVEPVTIERPFLWEFRRLDSKVTSYLFGTIHVNDPNITKLHPSVHSAFSSASAVWFEIDFAKDKVAQIEAISLPPGQRLDSLIPESTVVRIDQRLKKLSPLLSRTILPEFRVVMWPLILANLEAQIRHLGTAPMDMQLQVSAQEAKQKTGGLEDPARQLQPLLDLPLEKQIEFLEASLDIMDADDASGINPLEQLVKLYAAGDSEALQEYLLQEMNRPEVSEDLKTLFIDTLLIRRNAQMVRAITAKLKAEPDDVHFVAIGTAHLLGKGSVVEGLRGSGFTVQRVSVADQRPVDGKKKE
ncbi:MAG: TraB/GumN family protein [Fuerstiella sp.]|nr:TraB/GumN family protein [Fuerstiella sp.]